MEEFKKVKPWGRFVPYKTSYQRTDWGDSYQSRTEFTVHCWMIARTVFGITMQRGVINTTYGDLETCQSDCDKLNSGKYYIGKFFPLPINSNDQ